MMQVVIGGIGILSVLVVCYLGYVLWKGDE